MSASIGKVPFFDHTTKKWSVFQHQLEQFLLANDIKEEQKKKAILLTSICETSYVLLENLMSPTKLETAEATFVKCVEAMNKHFKPPTSGFAERYKFYNAAKSPAETISEWAVRVRALAINCEFGEHLDTAIRDKFVMGLEKGPARDKIFLEAVTCSYQKVIEVANNAEYLKHQYDTAEVKQEPNFHFMRQPKDRATRKEAAKQETSQPNKKAVEHQCRVCGYNNHKSENCKFRNYKCNNCKEKGHLKKMCKAKSFNFIDNDDLSLFSLASPHDGPIKVKIFVNDKPFIMELDTGSENNVVSECTYQTYFAKQKLKKVEMVLKAYNGVTIIPIGECEVKVKYGNKVKSIPVIVIKNGGPPLLGRKFLKAFDIQICKLNYSSQGLMTTASDKILAKFENLFDGQLGTFKMSKAVLRVKEEAIPKFFRPRPLPLAIKDKVEQEIEKLVNMNILEPVRYSEWGTPIVPVLKKNGSIRICGDFKVTLNPHLHVEQYPLPRIEEIFSKLYGGEEFTKLDLSMAYQQIELEDESRKYTTISTSKGLFQYTRLIYGLASAPAIFQRIMDTLLAGLEGVVVFLDDILISASSRELHVRRLENVLKILNDAGFKLSPDKCEFFCKKIKYLGHVIDKNGLHMNPEKITDISNIPYPENVKQLQAFLGVVNFYRRFMPDASTLLNPLHQLLKHDSKFVWTKECSDAVDTLKKSLLSTNCLAHFNANSKTILTVDASPVGVGAVLSQIGEDGLERPIEFSSRTLTDTEKRYSQLDREAVAILFGVKKFHQFLYGRRFVLVTDNKPLLHIFGPKKGIPVMASSRLQRIALMLSGYQFDVSHVKSKSNIADYFSRYPQETNYNSEELPSNIYVNFLQDVNCESNMLNFDSICKATREDEILGKVKSFIHNGWPKSCKDKELLPYFLKRNELSEESDCVFWGYRVIIPNQLRRDILNFLHSTHMGIVKMKSMARECCWWPSQGRELEDIVRSCEPCIMTRSNPPQQELIPWPRSDEVWSRLHIDFFGPFLKRWCLVVVDSSSKWLECIDMGNNTSSRAVISVLREIFARFGLPKIVVSDNGTSFVSNEFKSFLKTNGIEQITSPVGNPATNGQAENAVKTIKNALKRSLSNLSLSEFNSVLCRFLFDYRNTIHTSTGVSPSYLMFNKRIIKSRLDLINPKRVVINKSKKEVNSFVNAKQECQKKYYKGKKHFKFKQNDTIMAKNYSTPGKISWIKGLIQKKIGKQTYLIKTQHNKIWKRHANQIISCIAPRINESETPSTILDPLQRLSPSAQNNVQDGLRTNIVNNNDQLETDYEKENAVDNIVNNNIENNNIVPCTNDDDNSENNCDNNTKYETTTKSNKQSNNENTKQNNVKYHLRERKQKKKQ